MPLIAQAVAAAGIDAPGLKGLTAFVEGRMDVAEWIAGIRRAEHDRRWRSAIAEEDIENQKMRS